MFNALAQQFKAEQPAQEAQQNNADMVARRKERRREKRMRRERERERNACALFLKSSSPFSLSWKTKSCISGRHNSSYKNLCSTPPRDSISAITLISVTTNLR